MKTKPDIEGTDTGTTDDTPIWDFDIESVIMG
jgi:hypothetical protein